MATNWPNSVQTFTNPTSGSALNSPSHADQHATVNDTVEALQQYAGLVFVKSVTVGSGVSSVTVTNAFDSRFEDYRVVISGMKSSTSGGQTLRMRFGSSLSTEYWGGGQAVLYSGTVNTWSFNNANQLDLTYLDTQPSRVSVVFDVLSPYNSGTSTPVHSRGTGLLSGVWVGAMYAPVARVQDLYFFTSSGTLTGGTIRVYGYNNGA